MGKLIKIHDIDEFSDVINIPDSAISEIIINNVRLLDEKKEIEKFIQQLLYDPNETPHGPTEIADILTTHLNVRGEKRFSGFVIKGKSFKNVTSRIVASQFLKLRQINSLGLIVFIAVGNIHDDAYRDFTQTALDLNVDYLIIDAQDLARLFIAYEKICPKDGTPYNNVGICNNGHVRENELNLEMKVREQVHYTIMHQQDLSHIGAKRYSLALLVDKHYPKDVIREIIKQVTEHYKFSTYYRNEDVKKLWGNKPAHVIWLYLAYDVEDIRNSNWCCISAWIDANLSKDMRPSPLNGNEKFGDIEILWNENYQQMKEFFNKNQSTKEEYLNSIIPLIDSMIAYAEKAEILFQQYKNKKISEEFFVNKMQIMWNEVDKIYISSSDIPLPPEDCKDYDSVCNSIFAIIHNMFLYFSPQNMQTWKSSNRDWLLANDIKKLNKEKERLKYEEEKLH